MGPKFRAVGIPAPEDFARWNEPFADGAAAPEALKELLLVIWKIELASYVPQPIPALAELDGGLLRSEKRPASRRKKVEIDRRGEDVKAANAIAVARGENADVHVNVFAGTGAYEDGKTRRGKPSCLVPAFSGAD